MRADLPRGGNPGLSESRSRDPGRDRDNTDISRRPARHCHRAIVRSHDAAEGRGFVSLAAAGLERRHPQQPSVVVALEKIAPGNEERVVPADQSSPRPGAESSRKEPAGRLAVQESVRSGNIDIDLFVIPVPNYCGAGGSEAC
jgi:hypothetical protein